MKPSLVRAWPLLAWHRLAFAPQTYGHSGLLDMLRTYDLLTVQQEAGNYWTVRLAPPLQAAAATVFNDIVASNGT